MKQFQLPSCGSYINLARILQSTLFCLLLLFFFVIECLFMYVETNASHVLTNQLSTAIKSLTSRRRQPKMSTLGSRLRELAAGLQKVPTAEWENFGYLEKWLLTGDGRF